MFTTFIACLGTETNSFANIPFQEFKDAYWPRSLNLPGPN